MIIKLKVKGRKINGVTEPDLPEHDCSWRINQYNPKLNEFLVTEEVDDLPSNLRPYLVVERDIPPRDPYREKLGERTEVIKKEI